MKNFVPIDAFKPFEPKTIAAMGLAFETSWQTLMVSGSVLVASFRAHQTREALALRIIDTAATGERDVTRLRDDAVAHVQANPAKAGVGRLSWRLADGLRTWDEAWRELARAAPSPQVFVIR